jgi:hypothetical protein
LRTPEIQRAKREGICGHSVRLAASCSSFELAGPSRTTTEQSTTSAKRWGERAVMWQWQEITPCQRHVLSEFKWFNRFWRRQ